MRKLLGRAGTLRATLVATVALAGVFVGPVFSGDTNEVKATADEAERAQRIALAKQFLVPESRLEQLRHQSMSWDDIFRALAIAQHVARTSTTPTTTTDEALTKVLDQRAQNLGWAKIALNFGFKFGPVIRAARKEAKDAPH